MNIKKPSFEQRIDAMASEAISNDALKLALEKHEQEKKEREATRALLVVKAYHNHIEAQVQAIRDARTREKQAKSRIQALEVAFEAFKKGDTDELKKLGVI